MGIEILLIFICSALLGYQGLSIYGIVNGLNRITLTSLDSNNLLMIIGLKVSQWGVLLGIVGIMICIVCYLECRKNENKNDFSKSYLTIIFFYILFSALSVL